MRYTFFIRMSDLHAMPITNITHSACYKVEMGASAGDLTRVTLDNNHTACKHICLQGIGCVCVKNYPPEIMQPSSSKRATIVSAENQNGATIVKATFFFCHYYIVWESNNAGEARGQSWNESLNTKIPLSWTLIVRDDSTNIITCAMAKVMVMVKVSSLSVARVCLFVCLPVSIITEKRLNGFSWNFQGKWDPRNNWEHFQDIPFNPLNTGIFVSLFGGIHDS